MEVDRKIFDVAANETSGVYVLVEYSSTNISSTNCTDIKVIGVYDSALYAKSQLNPQRKIYGPVPFFTEMCKHRDLPQIPKDNRVRGSVILPSLDGSGSGSGLLEKKFNDKVNL